MKYKLYLKVSKFNETKFNIKFTLIATFIA